MGFLDIFRSDRVVGTRVLVCALDARFQDLIAEDATVYRLCYPNTAEAVFASTDQLEAALARGCDLLHLLCEVNEQGEIAPGWTGNRLIDTCCDAGVKLLWVAADNPASAYRRGFNPLGKRINVVMTILREGPKFSDFLGRLLNKVAYYGDPMPAAWSQLCPQTPGAARSDAPQAIFFAGRGRLRLR